MNENLAQLVRLLAEIAVSDYENELRTDASSLAKNKRPEALLGPKTEENLNETNPQRKL